MIQIQPIYFNHIDIYPDRPDELQNCSLYEFLGWYEREVLIANDDKAKLRLKTFRFTLRRRREKPYLITHQLVNPHQSKENEELYYSYLLKLFKPWHVDADLQMEGKSYFETFVMVKDSLPDMVKYHEMNIRVSEQDALNEKAVLERAKQLETEPGIEDEEGCLEGFIEADHVQTAMADIVETHKRKLTLLNDDEMNTAYSTLNADQKRVVDKISDLSQSSAV